jgi:hypothetical protein
VDAHTVTKQVEEVYINGASKKAGGNYFLGQEKTAYAGIQTTSYWYRV